MAHYDNCLNKISALILFLRIDKQQDMHYDLTLSSKTEFHSERLHTTKIQLSPELLDDLELFQNHYRLKGEFENRSVQERAIAHQIYQIFFAGTVGAICKSVIRLLDEKKIETLLFVIASEDPYIMNLPFELTLTCFFSSEGDRNALLTHPSFGLIRTAVSMKDFKWQLDLPKVAPLKMLFIAALPENLEEQHKMLQLEAEQERLICALGSLGNPQNPQIVIEFLENASLEELDKALRERQHDMVHISGHGAYEPKQNNSILYFEDEWGNIAPVTGEQLGKILQKHFSVKLLMLSACETAWAGQYGSIAQQTALSGALTVVGMRFAVSDSAAQLFTTCFYTQLANQVSVTKALAAARHALYDTKKKDTIAEWFTPVVYQNGYIDQWLDSNLEYDLSTFFYQTSYFIPTPYSRRGNGFIGRKRYLIQLKQAFRNQKSIGLYGLGGLGKTTLAEAFAHHYEQGTYSVLLFRNQHEIQEKIILDRLLEWGQTVGLPEAVLNPLKSLMENPNYTIQHKLQKVIAHCLEGRKTILIFDNVEDVQLSEGGDLQRALGSESLKVFFRYLCLNKPTNCHLLFTSRYKIQDLEDILLSIALNKMSYAEQYRLLNYSEVLRRIPLKVRESIYKRFDGHPRAYEYLETLLKKDKTFKEQQITDSEGKIFENLLLANVYKRLGSWEKKVFQIAAIFLSRTPLGALESVWKAANQHWWQNFFMKLGFRWTEISMLETIRSLYGWSLCVWDEKQQSFEVHRLTRAWMEQYITSKHNIKQWSWYAALYFEQQPLVSDMLLAKDYFEKAQQWDEFLSASDRLIDFYKSVGLHAKAIEMNGYLLAPNLGKQRNIVARYDIGESLYQLGQLDKALLYWEETLKRVQHPSHKFDLQSELEGKLEFKIGLIREEQGDYKEALEHYKKALWIFEQSKAIKQKYQLEVAIAKIRYMQGMECALLDLKQLLEKQDSMEDWDGQVNTLSYIAQIHSDNGNYTAAFAYLVRLLEQFATTHNYIRLAYLINDISIILISKGYYQIAFVYLEKILPTVQVFGDSYCEFMILNSLSDIYTLRGDYVEAKMYWNHASALSRQSQREDMQSICFNNIAMLYFKQGYAELALKHLKYALNTAQKMKHHKDIINCWYNIAQVHITQGDFNLALQDLEQALTMAQATNNQREAHVVLDCIHKIPNLQRLEPVSYEPQPTEYSKHTKMNSETGFSGYSAVETATMSHAIGAIFVVLELPEDAIPFLKAAQYIFQQKEISTEKTEWYLDKIVQQLGDEKYQAILLQLNIST